MFNDLSSPAALVATRRSGKARDMGPPAPDAAQLGRILHAASRVPDHGKLAPWRFVVVPADARNAFAALLHRGYAEHKADVKRLEREAIDQFAQQAPALVVVLSCPAHASHIPLWEQELSAGAACQNLLVAAHAEGFVGNWLTGWAAYSPIIAEGLGGRPGDKIAGFIFLGTATRELDERPRPDPAAVISTWAG